MRNASSSYALRITHCASQNVGPQFPVPARAGTIRAMKTWIVFALLLCQSAAFAEDLLRVPAFTAYLDPNPRGATVSERSGITRIRDKAMKVVWFGEFKNTGSVDCSVELRLPPGTSSSVRLTVGDKPL